MKASRFSIYSVLLLLPAAPLAAADGAQRHLPRDVPVVFAVAQLAPTQGSKVKGTVRFFAEEKGVRVVADIEGLTPGDHGFHVHEHGDCSAPDASSAGGHFNPGSKPHGARTDEDRHIGDLGNVTAGPDGRAHVEFLDEHLSLLGEHSIIGKSVIVHAGKDDLKSQPSGDAGGRVACGVISEG